MVHGAGVTTPTLELEKTGAHSGKYSGPCQNDGRRSIEPFPNVGGYS
jgi:hypothetical protein